MGGLLHSLFGLGDRDAEQWPGPKPPAFPDILKGLDEETAAGFPFLSRACRWTPRLVSFLAAQLDFHSFIDPWEEKGFISV